MSKKQKKKGLDVFPISNGSNRFLTVSLADYETMKRSAASFKGKARKHGSKSAHAITQIARLLHNAGELGKEVIEQQGRIEGLKEEKESLQNELERLNKSLKLKMEKNCNLTEENFSQERTIGDLREAVINQAINATKPNELGYNNG